MYPWSFSFSSIAATYIDTKLNTGPIFMLIFLVLGIGGAFMSVYKTVIGYTKRKWEIYGYKGTKRS